MEAKIIYAEGSSKCKKVADAVGQKLQIPVVSAGYGLERDECDFLVIVGNGPYSGKNNFDMEQYVKQIKEHSVKMAALITLDSLWSNISLAEINNINSRQVLVRKILEEKDVDVIDEHMCQTQYMLNCIGHPNKNDIYKTIKWLENVLEMAGNSLINI